MLQNFRHYAKLAALTQRAPKLRKLLKQLSPRSSGHELLRFGPDGDGGYLVPDDLEGIRHCFSPGVCLTSGFETRCASMGMNVFMADASVDGPAGQHKLFSFQKKFIGPETRGEYMTLKTWVEDSVGNDSSDLLLQMDIEGHEYDVINSTPESLLRQFRIMVIEFHGLRCLLNGFSGPYKRIDAALQRLLRTHVCVHAHPNNTSAVETFKELEIPDLMELTFLRRDRLRANSFSTDFPHALDLDNDPRLSHVPLPACWWRSSL